MQSNRKQRRSLSKSSHKTASVVMEGCEDRRMFSTYVVTNTASSGTGSLYDAIKKSNSHAGADVIDFKIGSGTKTITPTTGLPYISDPVTIDATTQPGYAGKPIIELNGSKSNGYGLNVGGGNSTIKGLVINHYSSGILLVKKGGDVVKNCYIGTDVTGEKLAGNSDKGIIVQTAGNTIGGIGATDRNVISGNKNLGIQFYTYTAASNRVQGNYIGTDGAGKLAIPNGMSGIGINGAPNNVIGGTTAAARNVISGNMWDGIVINTGGGSGTVIQGNYIGTDVTGTVRLGNLNYGVETSQAHTVVGGTAVGARNIISGNSYSGVVLWKLSGSYSTVVDNYIGTDVTGKHDLGNYWSGVDISNGSSNNLVQGNVISGNDTDGVMIYQGSNNTIQSNIIGWDVTKKINLYNDRDGIRLTSTTADSILGNYIGNNHDDALFRTGGGTFTISGNTILNDELFNITI